ncbi:MAG: cytochrome C oxidase subunit III [Sulfurimonas sp. RIFCSPHIGHO2_12_FULL_36_9]|uniref:cbb3-type cytochrome c oxidase N-terminal domain-containing protein n=1 Tax=Sulfurimonas sp. RIFCSPLOWO2_12_36_12 TaxID=1802253 RepID=UPI0008D3942F|nr:cbb3-type cytochrome c oxidase N-terminal domain-containing protein [Sulfurimonas sp. RIFCSPLOWO2_12_36_12]OHD96338.1 MAG: cytochrome C oxidase subunit III [Sulfurimonas sp. RIFCSPHIGHO2_12_FULL_36_9]OHE00234.1 MAG: cytochrome C oxidase subunit III [Sulfurimonas sp. RIFCSPLOWO2_12_36_12]
MNKLYLWGIIIIAVMLGATYLSVGGSKGGLNDDIVNMLAITGAVALVIITVFVVIKYVRQMQVDSASGELADENWDGIGEYKNSVPTGWAVMFLLTMVWGMWYFTIGYPVNSYSQIGEYNEDTLAHNAKFEAQYKDITGDRLIEMGESVFLAECKVCHGINADGIDGKAANLNKRISVASVKHVLEKGSNNKLLGMEMPMPDRNGLLNSNTGALITDAEIEIVSAYVANGMSGEGADVFAGACSMCHGADGKGMEFVAPNIASFSPALVSTILAHGKKGVIGVMPKFERLNDKQKEAVGAYITSISK